MSNLVSNLTQLLNPAVNRLGFLLEEVRVTPVGKRRIISVIVDQENRNPNLDEVTVVSRQVSEILDNYSQLGDQPFTLEVTTPGVDRPLMGRLVKVTLNSGDQLTGRIIDISDNGVEIEVKQDITNLTFSDIKRAQIEIEFNRKRD